MVGGRVGSVEHINMFVCRVKSSIECFTIGPFHPFHHAFNQCSDGSGLGSLFPNTWNTRVLGERLRQSFTDTQTKSENMGKIKEWIRSQFVLFTPFKIMGELHELPFNVTPRDLYFFNQFYLKKLIIEYFGICCGNCVVSSYFYM